MNGKPRVLVTGATGFVGTALVGRLVDEGWPVRASTRWQSDSAQVGAERVVVGDLAPDCDWGSALAGEECVVHLAGRVHVMKDNFSDPLAEFRRVNVEGTLNLARQAAKAGIRRFIFLSSVKVNGELGTFRDSDPPNPQDSYSLSKNEAELGLREISREVGMEVVIIRPPLVYGPGVKANFRSLIRAVERGIPLPLGATRGPRSLLGLYNLVDFIMVCIQHPAAANQTFLVSDGEDLTVTDLIRRLAGAMGRPARLIPVPASALMRVARLAGKGAVAERLLCSLLIDGSRARRLLGWTPPISVDEGLRRTVMGGP